MIYLDYNSTTPLAPEVIRVINECYESGYLNPASQHREGQRARQKVEQLRTLMCEMLGCETRGMETDRFIVTSGATESNNLALLGLATGIENDTEVASRRILISAIEHPSIVGAAAELARRGFLIETIRVDSNGVCDLDHLKELVNKPALVASIMLANNETGVIQPVQQAAAICREKGILFHTDAVQAIGKMPVDFRELGIDLMSITAHKLHGPRGIGGLAVRAGIVLHPLMHGGFQQTGTRPGTEDVAMLAGMCRAIELYHSDPDNRVCHLAEFRDRLAHLLSEALPGMIVNGANAPRVPHTLNVSFPGINRQELLMAADFNGLAISTGSACASGSSEPSPVLLAMGANEQVIEGSIRISIGVPTTAEEIDLAAEKIIKICRDLQA